MKKNKRGLRNCFFGLVFGMGFISCNNVPRMDLYTMDGIFNDSIYICSYEKKNFFGKDYFVMEVIPENNSNISYRFIDYKKDKQFDSFVFDYGLVEKSFSRKNIPLVISEELQKKYKSYLDFAFTKRIKGLVGK